MTNYGKRFLRLWEVKEKTGYSRSSIYALMRKREFPLAYPLGARAVGWLQEDIDRWIEERLQGGQNQYVDRSGDK